MTGRPIPRTQVVFCLAVLLAANLAIVGRLFAVEFSAYTGSVEGTFIAIARVMRQHPFDWRWWPIWSMGMPFENTYLPFQQWAVAAFDCVSGLGAARSFHIVTAFFYGIGAPAMFWLAWEFTRKLAASFFAGLVYSCVSFSTLLIPAIRFDSGGALHLRRLEDLVVYGEAPHTVALALLPLAVLCFARANSTRAVKWNILAGLLAAAVVLANAFGIIALGVALVCWLAAFAAGRLGPAVLRVGIIGVVSYCLAAPWLSPSMIRAILNAQNIDGDYHYRPVTWMALALTVGGFSGICVVLRRFKTAAGVRFFVLYAYAFTVLVGLWYAFGIALLPQPHRYQLEMDLGLSLTLPFLADALPRRVRFAVAAVAVAALAVQTVSVIDRSRTLIRPVGREEMPEYHIARWMDEHLHGERAFIGDSASFLYNVFTDNPQIHGGHIQFEVNSFVPIVDFTLYTDTNAGARAAEYSVFWLKAFGAQAVAVSGPDSRQHYRPFAHPFKFDGVLPVLWREGGDTIYAVPSRSTSLAHVIPAGAVVARRPAHGLDIAPAGAYVAALDDPAYPLAVWRWKSMSEAEIATEVRAGEVVAVQETYDPGWEAWWNGRRCAIRRDALGLMIVEPPAAGPCDIVLRYTGGAARIGTRILSLLALLAAAMYAYFFRSSP